MKTQLTSLFYLLFCPIILMGQIDITGKVLSNGEAIVGANIYSKKFKTGTTTDKNGEFVLKFGEIEYPVEILVSFVGFKPKEIRLNKNQYLNINLEPNLELNEVVVTGTLNPVKKLDSPVPVEVYTKSILTKNPAPNIFESLERINGVRPQINCNVCNTGDIHINGLEGPYTMILIDGMPIVSGLSTVYGLSGIPNGILDQVEVVKGPSSALYGSEALGGVINIITKLPNAKFGGELDFYATSWLETNTDLSLNTPIGKGVNLLTGINHFQYNNPKDNNGDNFTDITLQNRISLFNKLAVDRKNGKHFSVAARYFYEDRWGGEMNWTPEFAGGDSVYGETIQTERIELVSLYDIPSIKNLQLQTSYNRHEQSSFYGTTSYNATQQIGFGQLVHNTKVNSIGITSGLTYRFNIYDDNTTATEKDFGGTVSNNPSATYIPGVFVQVQQELSKKWSWLAGARLDHQSNHGNIFTPRFAVKFNPTDQSTIRLNGGTGFRVVNIFTEDHAALTGAREVVIAPNIKPEQSKSLNLNYEQHFYSLTGDRFGVDFNSWYTHFSNQIIPDYESNPNEIRYENLDNYSVSRGISANLNAVLKSGLSILAGVSYIDVFLMEQEGSSMVKSRPLLSENWTGTWTISYPIRSWKMEIDYTGNLYGPMLLPTLGELDPRPKESPWWSIQNLNFSYKGFKNIELYGGIKNLLNFTPAANSIARAFDPFDKGVTFDGEGNAVATPSNPNALTFDPSYVYAPNQGRRTYLGLKWIF
ncbi:TonB-dependent receptor [Luteibaculum oceani]|uniref:TonB-dependent receptor n=1 Tax=Luteibaculum oceani TaxID=1294296 RepID=A0A5C6V9H3_9FLAO|nr:TonB-dependent receptor [Luteibaculum oceani]TXC82142.1 TonB-dependent receptor [Luteibaculum oceani]